MPEFALQTKLEPPLETTVYRPSDNIRRNVFVLNRQWFVNSLLGIVIQGGVCLVACAVLATPKFTLLGIHF